MERSMAGCCPCGGAGATRSGAGPRHVRHQTLASRHQERRGTDGVPPRNAVPSSAAPKRHSGRVACTEQGASEPTSRGTDTFLGSSRRRVLMMAPLTLSFTQAAEAASRFEGFLPLFPPDPVKFPRKSLDQKFAVLMMRSAYEVTDALDFIPMDQFQIKFWKLRQNEWSAYTTQYSPITVKVGQLTDPLYFDFINYTQYALLAKEIPKGQMVFEEFCEMEEECPDGRKRVVKRDQRLSDNKMLPDAMEAGIGDKIYGCLLNGFEGEVFDGPAPLSSSASFDEVVNGVSRIVQIFTSRGYALKGTVVDVAPGNGSKAAGRFTVRMEAPCNYWGIQRLGSIKAPLVNAMDAMTIAAFIRASSLTASYTLSVTDTGVEEEWVLS